MKKTLKYIVILLITFLIPITSINAKTIGDIQKEIDAAQKKLNDTNTQKAINKQTIEQTNSKINTIKNDISKAEEEIKSKTEESQKLEKDIEKKNEEIKSLIKYYEVSSSGSSLLEYIMGADSLTDLIYRLSITEQISNYNKKVIKQMNDMIAENEKVKKELANKKEQLASLKSDLETQVTVLTEKQSKLAEEGLSESESIKEMQSQLKYYRSLKCKDSDTIDGCLYKAFHKNNSSGSSSSGGSTGGYLPSGTTFFRPTTSGKITSEFGNRTLYGSLNKHFAIDISMPTGTTVYSVAPGMVTKTIRSNSGGGNQIIIQHYINGQYYTSYYCHLSVIGVSAGQAVTKDSIIGKSGNSGNTTGPHLHLGLATGRWYVDYYNYYGSKNSFESHTFNPRNVITFPPKGSSYSNR